MPGSRLSDCENRLLKRWQNGKYPYPTLRGISIQGDPGLRGIKDLEVEFRYPLTVVCGKNGSGKTTILDLAALGFHFDQKVPGFRPEYYYTFSRFFYKGPGDPDITGVKIRWDYDGNKSLPIEKESVKWMHYERRPRRPVYHLDILRPAIAHPAARSHFKAAYQIDERRVLNEKFRRIYSEVMGRQYESAEVMQSARYSVRQCNFGNTYSSFNMGAGEDSILDILDVLQKCPDGSLLVIEEIETGIHPEALVRLAQNMLKITDEKSLQVIVSTHSSFFIDNVPREARLYVERADSQHKILYGPTTRFVVGLMAGRPDPELHVYCEDSFSKLLIEHALPFELRRRIRIVPFGSKDELPKIAAIHIKSGLGQRILLAWDGDVTLKNIIEGLKREKLWNDHGEHTPVDWIKMPSGEAPEEWALKTMDCQEGYEILAKEFNMGVHQAAKMVQELKIIPDPHDIGHEMELKIGLDMDAALRSLARCVANMPGNPLGKIADQIERVLRGESIKEGLETAAGKAS